MEKLRRSSLVGIGLMLGLVVVGLFLVGLAAPAPGLAAPPATWPQIFTSQAEPGVAPTGAYTAFLPLIHGVVPIVPNVWKGEYFDNAGLSGDPQYTTEEVRVDYDWGDGSAPSGLPLDHFSVRWTGYWDFEIGEYTLFVKADDGVRLRLDGDWLIEAWTPGIHSREATVVIDEEGLHRLELEYFENTGDAAVRLHWRRTDLYPQWSGEYFDNAWVEDPRTYRSADRAIQFDWGNGCPAGLQNCDRFSIAWTANPLFEAGTYRIFLYADEGYQLFVDGDNVKEGGWYDGQAGGAEDAAYVLETNGIEHHRITYNFHDRGTLAEARLWMVYMEHPTWNIEFYDNINLNEPPILVDPDGYKIFFDWGLGKPRSAMPSADHFSIRWTGQRYFHAGCYRFGIFADDGVRLWVDGEQLVNEWKDGRGKYHGPVTYLSTGYHEVIVEYYENTGEAEIRFWWE